MSLSCGVTVRALRRALALTVPSVKRSAGIPVLGGVLLTVERAGEWRLSVEATDLDHAVRVRLPVERLRRERLPRAGTALVDGARLLRLLKLLPAGDTIGLTVPGKDKPLELATGAGTFSLAEPASAADWPDAAWAVPHAVESDGVPSAGSTTRSTTLGPDFVAALARVRPFMSDEEFRYYLNGVFLHLWNKGIALVATDGHTLGRVSGIQPRSNEGAAPFFADIEQSTGMAGVIIPAVAVKAILRCFGSGPVERLLRAEIAMRPGKSLGDGLTARPEPSRFRITAGDGPEEITVSTHLIDGTFPDYRRVLPETATYGLTVSRPPLASALRFARAVSPEERAYPAVVSVQEPDGEDGAGEGGTRLVLDMLDHDGTGGLVSVPAIRATPGFEPTGFNPAYIARICTAVGGDEITFGTNDAKNAAIVEAGDFTGLIMPMRFHREPRLLPGHRLATRPAFAAAAE